jgi:hydrogenase maturation protease
MKNHEHAPSFVVLGVGNILKQDDGVGVRVVQSLIQTYDLPSQVRLIEAGIAGLGLLSDLEGAENLLIIDAVDGRGSPGTIYRLTPEDLPKSSGSFLSAHAIGLPEVLATLQLLGNRPRTRIIGIQPLEVGKMGNELTPPLRKVIPLAVAAVIEELQALGVKATKKEVVKDPTRL